MFQHESVLDLNKLYCNNIHEMARYYGIEAAAKAMYVLIIGKCLSKLSKTYWKCKDKWEFS